MAGKTSRASESNGQAQQPERGGVWASPPTGSRAPDRRVPGAAPEGADVWLTAPVVDQTVGDDDAVDVPATEQSERGAAAPAPESVELIEIVEDLRRDVVEPEVLEAEVVAPETEPEPQQLHAAPEAPGREIRAAELAPAEPGEVNVAGAVVALNAVLSISLAPEWPGNVHVYEITIDVRDGTFVGTAAPSSNVPGETIRGVFGDGFADIDFAAAYPLPGPHYAWFGAGPLHGFTGTDSRGNVFRTVAARVTNLAYVVDDASTDEQTALPPAASVVEDRVDESPVADESLHDAAATDTDEAVAERWFETDTDPAADEQHEESIAVADETGDDEDEGVAEPSFDTDLATDEPHEVTVAQSEVTDTEPEQDTVDAVADVAVEEPIAVAVETPADHSHAPTCRCLACESAAFEAVPVTEGPLAGKAFYFRAKQGAPT